MKKSGEKREFHPVKSEYAQIVNNAAAEFIKKFVTNRNSEFLLRSAVIPIEDFVDLYSASGMNFVDDHLDYESLKKMRNDVLTSLDGNFDNECAKLGLKPPIDVALVGGSENRVAVLEQIKHRIYQTLLAWEEDRKVETKR